MFVINKRYLTLNSQTNHGTKDSNELFILISDQTACIWGIDGGRNLLQYTGHSGSVNSVKFHPSQDLILSASGDHTAHVWQAAITPDQLVSCVIVWLINFLLLIVGTTYLDCF